LKVNLRNEQNNNWTQVVINYFYCSSKTRTPLETNETSFKKHNTKIFQDFQLFICIYFVEDNLQHCKNFFKTQWN